MSTKGGGADLAERVHARIVGEPVEVDGEMIGEFVAHIRYLADGSMALDSITLSDPLPPVPVGTTMKMARAVAGDATYVWTAYISEIINPSTGSMRLAMGGAPQRMQQREHVRVNTKGLPVTLRPVVEVAADDALDDGDLADGAFDVADEGAAPEFDDSCTAALRDISAGGARVILDDRFTDRSFPVGATVRVHLSLPSGADDPLIVDLDASVRWAGDNEGHQVLGLAFRGVGRRLEGDLTRWVFAEEARQSRMTRR